MKKIILVDFFNTIMGRRKLPEDVLLDWGEKMHDVYSGISSVQYYNMFKNAWKKLSDTSSSIVEESDFIITTHDIFSLMAKDISKYHLIQDFEIQKFIDRAQEEYFNAEHEAQYLKTRTINYLKKCRNKGCKIYIVSDFYCSKDVLRAWLVALNLNVDELFDDIFVSSDYKASKVHGTLYKKVLEMISASPKDVMMIGDNYKADKKGAKKQGILSKLVFPHIALPTRRFFKALQKIDVPVEYQEIFEEDIENGSYSNYAFPLYLFTKKLAERCEANGTKNLFFLARDGWLLKTLFDEYCVHNHLNIKTHYMAVSRKSALNSSILPYEETFKGLSNRSFVSVGNFLKTLNFKNEEIEKIGKETGVSLSIYHLNLSKTKAYQKVLSSSTFRTIYDKYRHEQHKAFLDYVDSFGVDIASEGFCYVDSGWLGNMGRHIERALKENIDDKVNMNGYFIGCMNKTSREEKMYGLLFSYISRKNWESKILSYRKLNFEAILRTDQNSCTSYDIETSSPIYSTGDEEKRTYDKFVCPMQEKIVYKFRKIMQTDDRVFCPLESVVAKLVYNIFRRSTKQDAIFFDGTQKTYCDNFAYIGFTYAIFKSWMRKCLFGIRDAFFIMGNGGKVRHKRIALK